MNPAGRSEPITLGALATDPARAVEGLRPQPVVWVPDMAGWLVIGRELAVEVLRRPDDFTVDDPRFTTARVVGPTMLSLDGDHHTRHRSPFVPPFKRGALADVEAWLPDHARALLTDLGDATTADLRTDLAGPLAATTIHRVLGLVHTTPETLLGWYRDISGAVSDLSTGAEPSPRAAEAMAGLRAAVEATIAASPLSMLTSIAAAGALNADEVAQNTAVVLFGAIETAEGMTANAIWHLLSQRETLERVRADRSLVAAVVEESLRLDPAAAVVDRYATGPVTLAGNRIANGDLIRVSLAAAGRDPGIFDDPHRFDIDRPDARLHLAFATGPHLCIGLLLARLETAAAIDALLDTFDDVTLAADATPPSGLIFRKPEQLTVRFEPRPVAR